MVRRGKSRLTRACDEFREVDTDGFFPPTSVSFSTISRGMEHRGKKTGEHKGD